LRVVVYRSSGSRQQEADFTNDADWTFTNHAPQTPGSFAIGMRFLKGRIP